MTTIKFDNTLVTFDRPLVLTATGSWNTRTYHAFRLARQAKRGTGVYVTLYRLIDGQLVKASETLKHLRITGERAELTFDRAYQVGRVIA